MMRVGGRGAMPSVEREYNLMRLAAALVCRRLPLWILLALGGVLAGLGLRFAYLYTAQPYEIYAMESLYYVEYGLDPKTDQAYTYINGHSWDVWLDSDEFVARIEAALPEAEREYWQPEHIRRATTATLPSDLRMPKTRVEDRDPSRTVALARALEEAVLSFGLDQKEIERIRIVDSQEEALPVDWDGHWLQSALLGLALALGLGLSRLLWRESLGLSLHVPAQLPSGLPSLGALGYGRGGENLALWLESRPAAAILPIGSLSARDRKELQERGLEERLLPPLYQCKGNEACGELILACIAGPLAMAEVEQAIERLASLGWQPAALILAGVDLPLQAIYSRCGRF